VTSAANEAAAVGRAAVARERRRSVAVPPGLAYTWGSTPEERAQPFPCDAYVAAADDACFRAVDVNAPAAVVFRWLCQLKAAPYSYDWIDNFGITSPRRLTPGLERLSRGERVMRMFTLADFEVDRQLTVVLAVPFAGIVFGGLAATYAVAPGLRARSRIVVKLLIRYPPPPVGWALRLTLPWGDLIMMRKQLLNLKELAEADARVEADRSAV
jgi:hypothetical protein